MRILLRAGEDVDGFCAIVVEVERPFGAVGVHDDFERTPDGGRLEDSGLRRVGGPDDGFFA